MGITSNFILLIYLCACTIVKYLQIVQEVILYITNILIILKVFSNIIDIIKNNGWLTLTLKMGLTKI